jgi:hypothetical protein
MPKTHTSLKEKLQQYVNQFPNDFKTDGKILFCKLCNKAVTSERMFFITQHLSSVKHKQLKERHESKTQQLIGDFSSEKMLTSLERICVKLSSGQIYRCTK